MSAPEPDTLGAILTAVGDTILRRKRGQDMTDADGRSYVRTLLDGGTSAINKKVIEEAKELCEALEGETDERVASEAADLLFHVMVGLTARGLSLDHVGDVLRARFGRSGLDEKASRAGAGPSASPNQ